MSCRPTVSRTTSTSGSMSTSKNFEYRPGPGTAAPIGERRRQLELGVRPGRGAPDLHHERRRGRVAVHHAAARGGHDEQDVALAGEGLRGAGGAVAAEEAEHAWGRLRRRSECPEVLPPVRGPRDQLDRLAPVRVDHRHAVVAPQLKGGRPARPHPPRLEGAVDGPEPGLEKSRAGGSPPPTPPDVLLGP